MMIEKKVLKILAKIFITIWALSYVFNHIEITKLIHILGTANPYWLLLAFLIFNTSKIISSFRLNLFFHTIGIPLSNVCNLRLYYLGMFYNLFLPGGISGDGYKIYLLGKHFQNSYKKLFQAVLADRISGLVTLSFLAGGLFTMSSFAAPFNFLIRPAWICVAFAVPLNFFLTKMIFPDYLECFKYTTLYSFAVQLLQLLCAACIVSALPGNMSSMVDFLTIFLVSSVVAVLPISIGGIGVREFTFLWGFKLIGLEVMNAVTFSLIFFFITALSSFPGSMVRVDKMVLRVEDPEMNG